MVNKHIEYLSKIDQNFISYWNTLHIEGKEEYLSQIERIDNLVPYKNSSLKNEITIAHEFIKRIFIKIPHVNMSLFNIPSDWNSFIKSEKEKKKLFNFSKGEIDNFIKKYKLNNYLNFYGNIKSEDSLNRKLKTDYIPSNGNSVRDLWDIVRFRIVSEDLYSLLKTTFIFWDEFYEKIIKCYNYYSYPKNGNSLNHYRAIHFEVEISPGRIIEIQIVTKTANFIYYMDHSLIFKRAIPFMSEPHENWFRNLLLKSVLYEYSNLLELNTHENRLPLTMFKNDFDV